MKLPYWVGIDLGSTTTKAILIQKKGDEYRLVVRGEAPTTVEAPAEDVRKLATAAGVDVDEGRSAKQFRLAMESLWDLDLEQAGARLDQTLDSYPNHLLAKSQASRVERLSAADYRLDPGDSRSRGFWIALAAAGLLGAIVCGMRLGQLWARHSGNRPPE